MNPISAKRTLKILEAACACTCLSLCSIFIHQGRRLTGNLDSLPPVTGEITGSPNAPSQPWPQNHGRILYVRVKVLRKLTSQPRNQRAVSKKSVYLHPRMNGCLLGSSNWCFRLFWVRGLQFIELLGGHSLLVHTGQVWLPVPGLVLLTLLNILQLVHPGELLHLGNVLSANLIPSRPTQPNQA